MYTAFRSFVICNEIKVAKRDGAQSLHHLVADPLRAESRPGFKMQTLFFTVETDGQRSIGELRLRCAGMDERFPVDTPAGHPLTAFALFLPIPVFEVGELVVTLEGQAKLLETRWGLDFWPDAQVLVDPERLKTKVVAMVTDAAVKTRAANEEQLAAARGPWGNA